MMRELGLLTTRLESACRTVQTLIGELGAPAKGPWAGLRRQLSWLDGLVADLAQSILEASSPDASAIRDVLRVARGALAALRDALAPSSRGLLWRVAAIEHRIAALETWTARSAA